MADTTTWKDELIRMGAGAGAGFLMATMLFWGFGCFAGGTTKVVPAQASAPQFVTDSSRVKYIVLHETSTEERHAAYDTVSKDSVRVVTQTITKYVSEPCPDSTVSAPTAPGIQASTHPPVFEPLMPAIVPVGRRPLLWASVDFAHGFLSGIYKGGAFLNLSISPSYSIYGGLGFWRGLFDFLIGVSINIWNIVTIPAT